jgi:hypothetical protein
MVTVCAAVNEPPAGEMAGVATIGVVNVKLADASALLLSPLAAAIALIVSVEDTEIAAEYLVEDVVGVLPSVV